MSAAARHRAQDGEASESVFMSMTDLTVGVLLVFMLILAYFALVSKNDVVDKAVYETAVKARDAALRERDVALGERDAARRELARLRELLAALRVALEKALGERDETRGRVSELEAEAADLRAQIAELSRRLNDMLRYRDTIDRTRNDIVSSVSTRLDAASIDHTVDYDRGIIRLKADVLFGFNQSAISTPRARRALDVLGDALGNVADCYTLNAALLPHERAANGECNSDGVVVDAIYIEGHADRVGRDRRNRELSAQRANNAFERIAGRSDVLRADAFNFERQPVLSIAAYGSSRPVVTGETLTRDQRRQNRRIDVRIDMYAPGRDGMEALRALFGGRRDGGGGGGGPSVSQQPEDARAPVETPE